MAFQLNLLSFFGSQRLRAQKCSSKEVKTERLDPSPPLKPRCGRRKSGSKPGFPATKAMLTPTPGQGGRWRLALFALVAVALKFSGREALNCPERGPNRREQVQNGLRRGALGAQAPSQLRGLASHEAGPWPCTPSPMRREPRSSLDRLGQVVDVDAEPESKPYHSLGVHICHCLPRL